MNWLISDTHFSHKNIIKYCNRPFKSIIVMNETIINNINRDVGKNDILWHLGDWAYGRETNKETIVQIRKEIRCENIILILGNHDKLIKSAQYLRALFSAVIPCFIGFIEGHSFILTHWPMDREENLLIRSATKEWLRYHSTSICLHGHTHNNSNATKWNMCVENNNYKPVKLGSFL